MPRLTTDFRFARSAAAFCFALNALVAGAAVAAGPETNVGRVGATEGSPPSSGLGAALRSDPSHPAAASSPKPADAAQSDDVILAQYRTTADADGSQVIETAAAFEQQVEVLSSGTSSKSARKTAVQNFPLERLTEDNRQRAADVLEALSVYRELPTLRFGVEPDVYNFFLEHPDVAVSIWRVMGISQFKMWQTGPLTYEADVGDGTVGAIDVLYRGPGLTIAMCEGTFKSPLLVRPIEAKAVLALHSRFDRTPHGRSIVVCRLEMFVSFPSQTVETVARVVSPVSNIMVDRNFREISLFVRVMSLAMTRQPGWVEHVAGQLDGVLEVRKAQLLELTAKLYVAARRREAAELAGNEGGGESALEPLRTAASEGPPVK